MENCLNFIKWEQNNDINIPSETQAGITPPKTSLIPDPITLSLSDSGVIAQVSCRYQLSVYDGGGWRWKEEKKPRS